MYDDICACSELCDRCFKKVGFILECIYFVCDYQYMLLSLLCSCVQTSLQEALSSCAHALSAVHQEISTAQLQGHSNYPVSERGKMHETSLPIFLSIMHLITDRV